MLARASLLPAIAIASVFAAVLTTARARAEEPRRIELTWNADSSCPSREDVVSEVEDLVRGSPARDLIVARVEVEQTGGSWRVRIETRSGDRVGKREVEAESCGEIADATALILALMIDPSAALRKKTDPDPPRSRPIPADEPVPPPAPPAPSSALAPAPAAPSRAGEPPSSPLRAVAAAALTGDLGTLPAAALGVGVSGGIVAGAYRLTADLAYFPARIGRLADRETAGGEFTLVTGALVGCRTMLTVARARGALCLGAELDTVLATGFGVSSPQSGSARWGAILGKVLVEAPIVRPISVELRVAGVVPFSRPPFYFDDIGTVYRPTAVGLRLALGLAAHF